MGISKTWTIGAAFAALAVSSCVSPDSVETSSAENETPPFIDPVTLSQSMCSGQTPEARAAAARLNPGFDFSKPFALPAEVIAHFHYPVSTASREAQTWLSKKFWIR